MKNILKCLSVLAIAGTLGLNTLTVSAKQVDACEAGEVERTDYFLFLEVNNASGLNTAIDSMQSGKNLTYINGADKWNNLLGNDYITSGDIPVKKGGQSTSSSDGESWTAVEFWKRYFAAFQNKNGNFVYEDTANNTSYILHDKWYHYDDEQYTGEQERYHVTTEIIDKLSAYLQRNINGLTDSSDLIVNGTNIPRTNIDIPAAELLSSTKNVLRWKLTRVYEAQDKVSGVALASGDNPVVYSPAVAYAKYCVKGTSNNPSNKTITYDANSTEPVVGMPEDETFPKECTTISPKKPTRTGWTFLGWSTDGGATLADSQYNPGNQYCGDSIVLHAIWSPNQTGPFTVTYNANGGKDAPANQNGETGSCVAISSQKPTMQGNNFLGWSTDKNAKEPDSRFAAGQNYCGEQGSIELFAIWQTQTGISAHFIAFAAIAIISGAALIVAQKRDLFKQI